jgi:hypothetical protein
MPVTTREQTGRFDRGALLRHGAAFVAAGGGALLLPAVAGAAAIPDNDLAYLRLLIGVELLAADFQAQALAGGKVGGGARAVLEQTRADERAHYAGLARLVSAAGQVPATADDIDFSYPRGSFSSQAAVLKLAWSLETLAVGAYLGAVENVDTSQLRLPIGQIAANEAQHVSALAGLLGKPAIGHAFAPSLSIGAVSAALDGYES